MATSPIITAALATSDPAETVSFSVEYTDTFGGDANYCWVRRSTITVPVNASQALIMRRAKAAVCITGARGSVSDLGDWYDFRPYGSATVMFVSFDY